MEAKSVVSVLEAFLPAVAACIISFSAARYWSYTFDEPVHVASGMELLEKGTYMYEAQHPPLARLASALPLYFQDIGGNYQGTHIEDGYLILKGMSEEDSKKRLRLSRLGVLPFLFISTLLIFFWSKYEGGNFAGFVSALLFLSVPSVLAHGSLATTDSALSACLLAYAISLKAYREAPSLKNKIYLGISGGLSLSAKMSAIPFMFFIFIASIFTLKGSKRLPVLSLGIAILVLWSTYGFEISPLIKSKRANELISILPDSILGKLALKALETPIPLARYITGIASTARHAREGHGAVFMGELKEHGSIEFFPVIFLIKTPLPFLFMFFTLIALVLSKKFRDTTGSHALYPLTCAFLIFAFSLFSTINIGLRHILPVYGFLAVAIGLSLFKIRKILIVCSILALSQLYTICRIFPFYISYYNVIPNLFGKKGYEIACNSDYDWGQETSLAVDYLNSIGIYDYILANGTLPRGKTLTPESKGFVIANKCLTGADGGFLPERNRLNSLTIFKEIGDVTVIHKLQ